MNCTKCGHRIEPFTEREIAVIHGIIMGMSDREICQLRGMPKDAAKHSAGSVYSKIGARNRIEAAKWLRCELFRIGLREIGLLSAK